MVNNDSTPIIIPDDLDDFWIKVRVIIRKEVRGNPALSTILPVIMEMPGLTEKPFDKINEVCSLFKVNQPTIYDWIKYGKIKRVKT